ncbi:MAG: allophanate hydrolase [Opitutaceae bacterium]|nr:allophanate hydrolase [Opitutaceae bacterium]
MIPLIRPTAATDLVAYVEDVWRRCEAYAAIDPAVWIHRLPLEALREHARRVQAAGPAGRPLYGVPFAIKDNIDLAGVPTTAGCPGFSFTPTTSAPVVARLIAAGAIPVGKTNLDQFATGLVGTRSPHGAPRNVANRDYISGGSSSGSAVAVAAGLVGFALGTDTAGSGRVPAALNGIIGLKPTRGRVSARGCVPACRSLDCVSFFTPDIASAAALLAVAEGFDPEDPYGRSATTAAVGPLAARPRLGVLSPEQREWFGHAESPALFAAALGRLEAAGAEIVPVDLAPFLAAARLLYEGPWVAEREAAVGGFIRLHRHTTTARVDPTVAAIILGGEVHSAASAFAAAYELAALRRTADRVLADIDALVIPTIAGPYRVAEVQADPVRLNSRLGHYTNFMNLLDLCGLALPAGQFAAGPGFGVTLCAPAWREPHLLELGARYLGESPPPAAVALPPGWIELAVCGAHLRGQPLHGQLTSLGAQFVTATTTAPDYRLYALSGTVPPKPGLVRAAAGDGDGGRAIAVETYALAPAAFGQFVAAVPPPLVIGTVELADGRSVKGFLCEPRALAGAEDITEFGGWIAYRQAPRG